MVASRDHAPMISVKVLGELLGRLEGATGPDRELDCRVWSAVNGYEFIRFDGAGVSWRKLGGDNRHTDLSFVAKVTASLDAALALVERVLPGVWWHVAKGKLKADEPLFGTVLYFTHEEELGGGEHETSPAIATCIALVRALIDTSERPSKPRDEKEKPS